MRPRFPFSINSCSQGINNPIVTQCTMYKAIRQISEGNAIQTNLYRDWKLFIFEISSIKAIGSSCIFFSGSPPLRLDFQPFWESGCLSSKERGLTKRLEIEPNHPSLLTSLWKFRYFLVGVSFCVSLLYLKSIRKFNRFRLVLLRVLRYFNHPQKRLHPWSMIKHQQIRTGNRHLRLRE